MMSAPIRYDRGYCSGSGRIGYTPSSWLEHDPHPPAAHRERVEVARPLRRGHHGAMEQSRDRPQRGGVAKGDVAAREEDHARGRERLIDEGSQLPEDSIED